MFKNDDSNVFCSNCRRGLGVRMWFLLKGILPRELVSDGVLEYKIPSSTI